MKRLPMLCAALATLVIAATIGTVYTLGKVGVGGPGGERHFILKVAFADAAGLDQSDRPLAAVAGTRQGRVTDVSREGDEAIVTLELDRGVEGRIFRDATATIRPGGAVPVLSVDIDPGTPSRGALADGSTIGRRNSETYVAPDQVLAMLDSDTRAQLQVLVGQADVALRGRGDDLSAALIAAAPLADSAGQAAEAVADRRVLVRRLVGQLATLSRALAERRDALASALASGRRVARVTGTRSAELRQTMDELPAMLADTRAALTAVKDLSGPLERGLDGARPLLAALPRSLDRLERLAPQSDRLVRTLTELETIGAEQVPALRDFTSRLEQAAIAGRPTVLSASKTIDTLSSYSGGVAQLGDLISGALSTNDENGPVARGIFTAIEPIKPENFGLPAGTTVTGLTKSGGRHKPAAAARVNAMVAAALEHRCASDTLACLLRATAPGLPEFGGGGTR